MMIVWQIVETIIDSEIVVIICNPHLESIYLLLKFHLMSVRSTFNDMRCQVVFHQGAMNERTIWLHMLQ